MEGPPSVPKTEAPKGWLFDSATLLHFSQVRRIRFGALVCKTSSPSGNTGSNPVTCTSADVHGMGDRSGLEPDAERRGGSSPSIRTNFILASVVVLCDSATHGCQDKTYAK